MDYTDEFLNKIVSVGLLNYPLSKIINVLDIEDEIQFSTDFDNPDSPVSKAYQKGIDKSDYQIDSKLYELAKNGDVRSIELYNSHKAAQARAAKKEEGIRKFRSL